MTTLDKKARESAHAEAWVQLHRQTSPTSRTQSDAATDAILTAYLDALSSIPEQGVDVEALKGVLADCAQLLDAVKMEWSQQNAWSEWDQSVRDGITAQVSALCALSSPSHPAAVAVTDEMVERVSVPYDGFTGDVIGSYTTREGKRGIVVQQDGTRVVHVYGRSRIEAALVDRDQVK